MKWFVPLVLVLVQCCKAHAEDAPTLHRTCSSIEMKVQNVKYSIERQEHDTVGALDLRIATDPSSVEGERVVRLVCQLSKEFAPERVTRAWIFDDKTAARRLLLQFEDQERHGDYLWHLRGYYELNREGNSEYVEFVFPIYHDHLLQLSRQKVVLSR